MRNGILIGSGRYSGLGKIAVLATAVALGSGCSSASTPSSDKAPAGTSGEFISKALTVAPTFVASTGVLTIALTNETAEIYLQASDSSLVVNGVQSFDTATTKALAVGSGSKANVKSIVVTGSGSADGDVVILNYVNGLFGQGTATTVGTALSFTASVPNVLIIKGTAAADSFAAGAGGISLNNAKPTKDITFTNAPALSVFLGAGDDKFTSSGNAVFVGVFPTAISIYGGAGNDTLIEGAASTPTETFSGGPGTDTVDYSLRLATTPVSVAIDPLGVITSGGGAKSVGDPTQGAVEGDIILDAEVIIGSAGPDQMMGGIAGSVTLNGGPGNDTFCQGDQTYKNGTDILVGGGGVDTVDYSKRTGALLAVMDGKTASGDPMGSEKDIIGADVANLKSGGTAGAASANITGNPLDNVFTPGPGTNVISGLAGDDTMLEGVDANKTGNDTFHGGAGTDTVDYSQRGYGVALTGVITLVNGSTTVTTAVDNTAAVTVGDLITFSAQPGVNYTISAKAAGSITLGGGYTGTGSATTTATDVTKLATVPTHVVVTMDGMTASGDPAATAEADKIDVDVENLLGGGGADTLIGNTLDNDIEGNAGADILVGLTGNDTLVGESSPGQSVANVLHGNDAANTAEPGAFNTCINVGIASGAGPATVYATALTGTFALTASAAVTASLDQTGLITVGDAITFLSQPGVYYTVSAFTTTAITLSTAYTGTAAPTAIAHDGSKVGPAFDTVAEAASGTAANCEVVHY